MADEPRTPETPPSRSITEQFPLPWTYLKLVTGDEVLLDANGDRLIRMIKGTPGLLEFICRLANASGIKQVLN